jgi:hypothetical protein
MIFIAIHALMLIVLGFMAYDDYKTRSVELLAVILVIVLGIISFSYSWYLDIISFNDLMILGIITLCCSVLIYRKEMAIGDIGLIGVGLAMPFLTALSLLFFSIFVLISHIKGIKTNPFYVLFVSAMIIAILCYPMAIGNPRVCQQLDSYSYNFTENYCTTPFIITSGEYVYEQPHVYNESNEFNKNLEQIDL